MAVGLTVFFFLMIYVATRFGDFGRFGDSLLLFVYVAVAQGSAWLVTGVLCWLIDALRPRRQNGTVIRGRTPRRFREGRMSLFLALPFLAATGIYNPQVMHNGHCIAEPGTVAALYCVQAPAPPAHHHHHHHLRQAKQ
jgi:hypothetical protein